MTIILWVLQGLIAVHTAIGAVWKFTNSAQAIPSLAAIPRGGWLALSALEIIAALCLIAPAISTRFALLAPIAALYIALEMLMFTGFHMASAETNNGPMVYWLVVAALCAAVAYGRFTVAP